VRSAVREAATTWADQETSRLAQSSRSVPTASSRMTGDAVARRKALLAPQLPATGMGPDTVRMEDLRTEATPGEPAAHDSSLGLP
jgi:hypothetical protein